MTPPGPRRPPAPQRPPHAPQRAAYASGGHPRPGPRAAFRPAPGPHAFDFDDPAAPIWLPCPGGVEPLLADEAARLFGIDRTVLPADPSRRRLIERRGGVQLRGDARCAMRLNLHSRLAQRVLWPLASGDGSTEDAVYALARAVDWSAWITPEQTLRVDTRAQQSPLRSLNFATLRVKDAVCDALREATGHRPSVDTRHPHLSLVLQLDGESAMLFVDCSGEALFKRGWRDERDGGLKGEAPLKETLAAAMLAAAGWQGRAEDGPLLDPCCGAGTIAIEAAQIACGIAPGLKRRFAFEALRPFQPLRADWQAMKAEAQAASHPPRVTVHAGDVSFRMTDFAQRNAERAGVAHAIRFKAGDALQRPAPEPGGVIVMNPPYGERIAPKGSQGSQSGQTGLAGRGHGAAQGAGPGAPRERRGREGFEPPDGGPGDGLADDRPEGAPDPAAERFFSGLAAQWKRQYAGWTAWVLSPDARLPQALRLKATRRLPLWNGPIECRLFRFDLVAGRMPERGAAPAAGEPPAAPPATSPAAPTKA